jgi:hypothetical protein
MSHCDAAIGLKNAVHHHMNPDSPVKKRGKVMKSSSAEGVQNSEASKKNFRRIQKRCHTCLIPKEYAPNICITMNFEKILFGKNKKKITFE